MSELKQDDKLTRKQERAAKKAVKMRRLRKRRGDRLPDGDGLHGHM